MGALTELLRELWAERGRVGLVALGVMWGTLSLTVLMGFGTEFVTGMRAIARNSGEAILRFYGGATTQPFAGQPAGRSIQVHASDADVLRALPEVRGVSAEFSSGYGNLVRYGDRQLNVSLCGVEPDFSELRVFRPQPGGRFLNRVDEAERRRVAFLGDRVKRGLFGQEEAVGETLTIRGVPFTVVGVLQPRTTVTNYNGEDQDKVVIPASAFRDLRGWRDPTYLIVGLHDAGLADQAEASVYRILGERHGFDPDDRDALGLANHIEITQLVDTMVGSSQMLNFIVGFFGLLVAVIGVANVMFVLVEERRQEIGVQMALGARPAELAWQRVAEGLLVTLAGGIVGMTLGGLLLWGVNQVPLDPTARAYLGRPGLSLTLGTIVVAILAVSGAVAGWFPARRAAALEPVEALREE